MNGSSVLVKGQEALAQSKGSSMNYNQLSVALATFPCSFPLFSVIIQSTIKRVQSFCYVNSI